LGTVGVLALLIDTAGLEGDGKVVGRENGSALFGMRM